MARIEGINPADADDVARRTFASQTDRWGAPLLPHLLHARRPSIYRGVRAMWAGIDASGLLAPSTVALVNRRVASLIGCPF